MKCLEKKFPSMVPRNSLITQGTFRGGSFSIQTYGFSTVCQTFTLGFKNQRGFSKQQGGFRLSLGTVCVYRAQNFPKEQHGENAWL